MTEALIVVQLADIVRTYTVMVTALLLAVLGYTTVTSQRFSGRILVFLAGLDLVLVVVIFGQLANVGRTITWRAFALAIGVTVLTVTTYLEIRARRREDDAQATEGAEDGDQSSS